MHYFYSFKFKKTQNSKANIWYCQDCTIKFLKKNKTPFPKDVVGFRRYNEEKLNELIDNTSKLYCKSRESMHQGSILDKVSVKEVKRPISDQIIEE